MSVIDTNGQPVTAIAVGKKVVLRGDENSPVMVVVAEAGNMDNQGNFHRAGFACGWFSPGFSPTNGNAGIVAPDSQSSEWRVIQVHETALELASLSGN